MKKQLKKLYNIWLDQCEFWKENGDQITPFEIWLDIYKEMETE